MGAGRPVSRPVDIAIVAAPTPSAAIRLPRARAARGIRLTTYNRLERTGMAVDYQRYRFTVDEYYRMAEAGIFDEDSRVELIEGEIIQMPPIGPVHQDSVDSTNVTFVRRFSDV